MLWSRRLRLALSVAALCTSAHPLAQDTKVTWRTVAPGVEHARFTRGTAGPEGATGPWPVNLLRLDPAIVSLDVVRALDEAVGLETVGSLAARHGAVAAVNGGYFRATGTYRGDAAGLLQVDGTVLSEPDRGRAAVGIVRAPAGDTLIFGHVAADASVSVGGARRAISGINRARGDAELILFTPQFHRTTLTGPSGIEVVVRRGTVVAVRDGAGSSVIPSDGMVLSAAGAGAVWLREHAALDATVDTTVTLRTLDGVIPDPWARAEDIVAAGPVIVAGGREDITTTREQMPASFAADPQPRTAIGVLADGRVLLATVDGRRPPFSVGMTLPELARLMTEFGAVDALNLDGGGSTTMVVEGKVVNAPSDASGERPVGDAIIVRARR